MAKQYIKMCNIKMWENDCDPKRGLYSNSKWTPSYISGLCYISCRCTYSVAAFQNDDGTINIAISEVRDYQAKDNIADGISQGGQKPVVMLSISVTSQQ